MDMPRGKEDSTEEEIERLQGTLRQQGRTEKEIEQIGRVARQLGRVEDGKLVPSPFAKLGLLAFLFFLLVIGGLWLAGIIEPEPGD